MSTFTFKGTKADDIIKEGSDAGFVADVIEASRATPVIVDFWATWCGPCKQLGPALEKAVTEAKGAVRLVKVDVDKNQQLAAQMRIQSIPAVYAFFQGRPVDGFVGALPDSQIKSFVTKLAELGGAELGPSPVEEAIAQAEAALDSADNGAASAIFNQVLAHEPANLAALSGLVRALVGAGELKRAREVLGRVPADKQADAAVAKATAALELAEQAAGAAGKLGELEAKLERNPNDHQARHDLAMALYAAGKQETALVHEIRDNLGGCGTRLGCSTRQHDADRIQDHANKSGKCSGPTRAGEKGRWRAAECWSRNIGG